MKESHRKRERRRGRCRRRRNRNRLLGLPKVAKRTATQKLPPLLLLRIRVITKKKRNGKQRRRNADVKSIWLEWLWRENRNRNYKKQHRKQNEGRSKRRKERRKNKRRVVVAPRRKNKIRVAIIITKGLTRLAVAAIRSPRRQEVVTRTCERRRAKIRIFASVIFRTSIYIKRPSQI